MDIASLGIAVDSSDVAKASTDLDKLTNAGVKAEDSAKRSGTAWSKAFNAMAGDTQQIVRELQALNAKQDATAKLMLTIDQSVSAVSKSFAAAATSMSSYRTQAESLNAAQEKTNQGAQKTQEGLGKLNEGMARVGNTTKQTAAALRGVPAQFTDIVTSLQGGQAPLTVLLQQGGQLKDMFGGIGPAAKALGGYILGLVNPYTVAAAAAAALGLAYYKGSEESTAYQKALILTGNAAGTSAPQLAEMARQIATTVGTTGAAAEVLTQLASSGKVASGSFELISKAALEMQEATGRAASETVAEFVKIGKDPVAAAKDLDEQYHFLTQSVYAQIVALKEQGDNIGATKLLTDTYAETVRTRAAEITSNLGLVERAWNGVKAAAKGALDSTLSVGREQTLEEQAAALTKRLSSRDAYSTAPVIGQDNPDMASAGRTREQDESQLRYVNLLIEAEKTRTGYLETRENMRKAAVAATESSDARHLANLSNSEKREREIQKIIRETAAIKAVNPDDKRVQSAYVAKQIQDAKDKYKDPAKPKGPTPSVDLTAFNNTKLAMAGLVDDYKNSQKELEAEQKAGVISQADFFTRRTVLIAAEKEQVTAAYQAEIDALQAAKAKSSTTANQSLELDQKIATARADMLQAQKDADSQQRVLAANEASRLQKQTVASQAYVEQLERQRAALAASGSRAAVSIGLGDRQQGLQSSLDSTTDRFNDERAKLLDRRKTAPDKYSVEDYQKDLASLQAAENSYRDTVLSNYDKMTAAQSDWRSGATSAYQTYLESAQNVAGQTKSLFSNAFSSMEDAVANFAVTGKASFSDFSKSIIADMARIAARQAATGLLSAGASALSGLFGGGAAATTAGSRISDYTGPAFQAAVGARATGGSVSPSSLYQVNEKGAELYNEGGKSYLMTGANGGSVTPLTSGSAAATGGRTGDIHVTVQIASDGSANATSDTAGVKDWAAAQGKAIEASWKQFEARSLSAGGNIRKAINGRA